MRISAVLGQGVCLFYYCCYPSAWTNASLQFSSVQFSRSVVSDSLQPHESQHDRPPGPSPTSGVHSNSGLTRARQIEGAWAYYEWINKTSHSAISKWFVFKFQSLWTFQAIYFFFFFFLATVFQLGEVCFKVKCLVHHTVNNKVQEWFPGNKDKIWVKDKV